MLTVSAKRTKYGDPKKAVKMASDMTALELGVRIASQAKLLSPVDQGQLRNSLSASSLTETKLLNESEGEKADAIDTAGLKQGEVFVGGNSDHAVYQEYGTIKMVAKPFLRPSTESIIDQKSAGEIMARYSSEQMEIELKERKEVLIGSKS